jgi:hypothetical protein
LGEEVHDCTDDPADYDGDDVTPADAHTGLHCEV